jgi:aspartate aminotransferase
MSAISARMLATNAAFEAVKNFCFNSRYAERRLEPGICDFTFGNPHEMPLEGIVAAIRERAIPHDKNWFAHKTSEEDPKAFIAERLGRELDLTFEPDDIALTAGAFAAIMVAFRLVVDAGDEVIYSEPAWFCYEPMLLAANAVPRKVRLRAPAFDLDLASIEAAIGPKTRLVIVNTPHNPTGRIYSRTSLAALADLLERASNKIGHRIFLLSDEPYRQLRFDGRDFTSPATLYPWTLISYSYGKVLLAPGQRLGYLAISPLMPTADRRARGGLSCFYGRAVSLTLCSAIMESGEFLPESARHDWRGVYRAKSRSVSETRARMRSRSRSPPLPPPPPGFHSSS